MLPESSGKVYARKWNPRKEQIITPSRDIIDNTNYNNLHRPGTMFGNVNNPISDPTRLLPEHESQIRGLLNPHNSQIKGYLADPTGRYLPVHVATNKTNLKPISEYLPKPENKYNLSGGIKGFLPAHNENVANPLQAVNQNLSTIRPDLMGHGEVVYTTHTNGSISSANSIGANAKGADKLAELFKQMQS